MLGVVYAVLAAIIAGTADFIGGTRTRRTSAQTVVWASQGYGAILGGAWILTTQHSIPALYTGVWPIGAGLASSFGLIAFYRALSLGTMSLVAPIAALGALVPIIWGIVLGNPLGIIQVAGLACALAGVVLTSGGRVRRGEHTVSIVLASVAALGFGLSMVCLAKSPQAYAVDTVVIYKLVIVAALTGAWIFQGGWTTKNLLTTKVRFPSAGALLILGALDGGSNVLFVFAAHLDYLSIVSVVASVYPVITVILARMIHGERLKHWQQIGVVTSFLGIAMVAYGG